MESAIERPDGRSENDVFSVGERPIFLPGDPIRILSSEDLADNVDEVEAHLAQHDH